MVHKKDKNGDISQLDRKLGKLLSKAIDKQNDQHKSDSPCPSLEKIGAFIDGKLPENERLKIVQHLAVCRDCCRLFSDTVETMEQMEEPSLIQKKVSGRRKQIIYYAIAAALAFVVFSTLFFQSMAPSAPQFAKNVKMLASLTDNETIQQFKGKDSSPTTYGFNEGRATNEQRFFQIGIWRTRLGIALIAGNKEIASHLIERILGLLSQIDQSDELIQYYEGIRKKLEENYPPAELIERIDISDIFTDKENQLYVRFGQWAEGGRIAADVRKKEFFKLKNIAYFEKTLEDKDIAPGIVTALKEIKTIIKKNKFTPRDVSLLKDNFNRIIMYM